MRRGVAQRSQPSSIYYSSCDVRKKRMDTGQRMHVVIVETRQHVDNELQFFAARSVFLERVDTRNCDKIDGQTKWWLAGYL